ncbi:crosslink repair DNA glycosylase YcaQ family protein [Salinifilum aidingensis]
MNTGTARRTALAAQGFADRRPSGSVDRRHLRRVLSRIKLIQLDSVNVAVRAHYMPLFSRLGAFPGELVDGAAWAHSARRPRLLVEYWAHEASLVPVEDWPLLRWRMREAGGAWRTRLAEVADREPQLVDDVLAAVKERGPVGAGEIERELAGQQRPRRGTWWDRSDTKQACELLFARGELTAATRTGRGAGEAAGSAGGFERKYDLPERVLPPEVLTREVAEGEAVRALVDRAGQALGVGTETDLRDYYRLHPEQSRRAVAELVESGRLEPVAVRGWRNRAYRHTTARAPRAITGRALLAPFDPVVWERARTERLFGFRYRIEIYVPADRREYGYYVFPFLLDGELVARVDLKADRRAGALRVPAAFAEPERRCARVAGELAAELRAMADWLGLERVAVGGRGDLAGPLARELRDAVQ